MAMTIVDSSRPIVGGVDTHLDAHVAAALDANGGVLGVESFATTPVGFVALHEWLCAFGPVARVGIEGTGAYGAGLSRFLQSLGLVVIEVDRTNRQLRRMQGKSDPVDAIEAARAALSGRARGIAKTADGNVEAIRALLVAQRSGRQARARCLNQIRHLGFTSPDALREQFPVTSPKPTSPNAPPRDGLEWTVTRSCTQRNSQCGPSADAHSRSATTCTTSTRS
jgi:transposase